jgi:hypothetical protein
VRELVAELGFDGGKTLVYEYVAELRPLLSRGRATCAAADASVCVVAHREESDRDTPTTRVTPATTRWGDRRR